MGKAEAVLTASWEVWKERRLISGVDTARMRRFVVVGAIASLTQLALLTLLVYRGLPNDLADVVGLLLAAQISFVLNYRLTWHDRALPGHVLARWLLFHVSVGCTTAVNLLTLFLLSPIIPPLVAALAGIAIASIGNFILNDRFVFRPRLPLLSES